MAAFIKCLMMAGTKDEDEKGKNLMMAGILFACTKDYKFLHSAHMITDAIIKAVKKEVPGMGDYLQGRLKTPTNLPNSTQCPIKRYNKNYFMELNDSKQRKYIVYKAEAMEVFSGKKDI